MAKKKKELSPEEIQANEERKAFNRKFSGFKRTVKSNIDANGGVNGGIRKIELELEFLKSHPNTPRPKAALDHEATVRAIEEALNEYKEAI